MGLGANDLGLEGLSFLVVNLEGQLDWIEKHLGD
jgi:hypothetical protein